MPFLGLRGQTAEPRIARAPAIWAPLRRRQTVSARGESLTFCPLTAVAESSAPPCVIPARAGRLGQLFFAAESVFRRRHVPAAYRLLYIVV